MRVRAPTKPCVHRSWRPFKRRLDGRLANRNPPERHCPHAVRVHPGGAGRRARCRCARRTATHERRSHVADDHFAAGSVRSRDRARPVAWVGRRPRLRARWDNRLGPQLSSVGRLPTCVLVRFALVRSTRNLVRSSTCSLQARAAFVPSARGYDSGQPSSSVSPSTSSGASGQRSERSGIPSRSLSGSGQPS
jgi:hypothetical protein